MSNLVTLKEIQDANKYIKQTGLIHRTPLLTNCEHYSTSTKHLGCKLAFKLETLQNQGSFKIRGIANMLHHITPEQKKKGAVTMSAGNFGRSFSFCAQKVGISATILMPEDVPKDRVKICESNGARVLLKPRKLLQEACDQMVKEQGLFYVAPFDALDLIAGYGSIGLEILEDLQDVDLVLVGVGGGGLISGVAAAVKYMNKSIRVVGVEPKGAPCMFESFKQGKAVHLKEINTFVNGLAPPFCGKHCYEHAKQFVDDVVLVEDAEVKKAMKILFEDYKLVVEPAGAAAFAALLAGKVGNVKGKRVVCVVSGGNISSEELNSYIK